MQYCLMSACPFSVSRLTVLLGLCSWPACAFAPNWGGGIIKDGRHGDMPFGHSVSLFNIVRVCYNKTQILRVEVLLLMPLDISC
jgi:hypothetical protein